MVPSPPPLVFVAYSVRLVICSPTWVDSSVKPASLSVQLLTNSSEGAALGSVQHYFISVFFGLL